MNLKHWDNQLTKFKGGGHIFKIGNRYIVQYIDRMQFVMIL